MNKSRVESLSDGVIAIVITVMVFNLKPPQEMAKEDVAKLTFQILSYLESFFLVGIFWYKHNKLLFSLETMSKGLVWANHSFLFFISLVPFVTSWTTQSPDEPLSRFFYGTALLLCFLSFFLMQELSGALNKKMASIIISINLFSILTALYSPWLAYVFFGSLGLGYALHEEGFGFRDPKPAIRKT